MREARPPDFLQTVHDNWHKTTGYVVAGRQPCLRIRDDEVANVRRSLLSLSLDDVPAVEPPQSWVMAVVLCPGDDTVALTRWVKARRINRRRIWFYSHPDADRSVFAAWHEAGYAIDRVETVRTWQELHPLFGLVLNGQVYADWRGAGLPSR